MSESKPRVYYAVWEDATLNDDDSVDESGFCSGAISTHGGGNLHWDDNKFQVVHKDDYDNLKAENERLKKECAAQLKFMSETDTEMEMHSETNRQLVQAGVLLRAERDRALAMLKKMAEAVKAEVEAYYSGGDSEQGHALLELETCLAEYRREFGG